VSFGARKQPETHFKEKVAADLKKLGPLIWFEKIQQFGKVGTPDFLLCVNGYFVALELKKDAKEDPKPLQTHKLNRIKKARGRAFVAHPDNWNEILAEIIDLATN